jgi:hypothetical protein
MFNFPEPTISLEDALAAMPEQVANHMSIRDWSNLHEYGRNHNMLLHQFRALKANHIGDLVRQSGGSEIKACMAIVAAAKYMNLGSMDATLTRIQQSHYAAIEALLYPVELPRGALS